MADTAHANLGLAPLIISAVGKQAVCCLFHSPLNHNITIGICKFRFYRDIISRRQRLPGDIGKSLSASGAVQKETYIRLVPDKA